MAKCYDEEEGCGVDFDSDDINEKYGDCLEDC
jgi:hypothetical protein